VEASSGWQKWTPKPGTDLAMTTGPYNEGTSIQSPLVGTLQGTTNSCVCTGLNSTGAGV
jgi:hypothetical protein